MLSNKVEMHIKGYLTSSTIDQFWLHLSNQTSNIKYNLLVTNHRQIKLQQYLIMQPNNIPELKTVIPARQTAIPQQRSQNLPNQYILKPESIIQNMNGRIIYRCGKYVVKQVKLNNLNQNQRQYALNQAIILKSLNHTNIVKCYQSFITYIGQFQYLYMVLQHCETDLFTLFEENKYKFSEQTILNIFNQILSAYEQLEGNKIVHRDIKLENILILKYGCHQARQKSLSVSHPKEIQYLVKLADFGFATKVENFSYSKIGPSIGTVAYTAPQILNKQSHTSKSDIWSLGIVLYTLFQGSFPWSVEQEQVIKQEILQFKSPKQIKNASLRAKQLIIRMLNKDQSKRIGWEELRIQVKEIMKSKWVNKQHSTSDIIMKDELNSSFWCCWIFY